MKEHKSEKELITAVIDLAASRREPISSSGELDEWLSFDAIVQALKELCNQLFIDKHIEQNCYQVLLKMSAESERHLTWWEKIDMMEKYFAQSPGTGNRKHSKKTTSMRSLSTPSPNLIRLVESERSIKVKPTSVPETSASALREANELSMLLNGTYGFQADRALTSSRETRDRMNLSLYSHVSPERSRANYTSSAVRHIHFQEATTDLSGQQQQASAPRQYQQWRAVDEEKPHHALSGMHSNVSKADASPSEIQQQFTPVPHSTITHRQSDWTLSPSVIHHHGSLVAETPVVGDVSISVPSLPPRAPPTGDNTLVTAAVSTSMSSTVQEGAGKVRSRAFSDLLNGSAVMRKYLSSGTTSTNQSSDGAAGSGRVRARSESPRRSPPGHALPAEDGYLSEHSPLHRHLAGPAATPQLGASRSARKGLFGSPPVPSPAPPQLRQHSQLPSTPGSTLWPRTPGRAVPLVLQGRHGAGGVYTPEGHINFDDLDIDARDMQHSFGSTSNVISNFASSDSSSLSSEHMLHTVTSTTRILVLFHRWLLQRSDHHSEHFSDPRNAAVMLAAHFSGLNDFVSSLFGLEQWLRGKMKLIAVTEAKAFVFRTWNLQYGVSAQSRIFWKRRRLHCGFEALLEYGMKRRMHRKNALHALALRRRHLLPQFMSPVLRHPRSAGTAASLCGLFTEEELAEASLQSSSPTNMSQLSGMSRFANLNVSLRHTAQRAQYSTSLSIREIVNDAKAAILTFSRGGNNANSLLVKTHEYLRAQDAVALLFAFRRFYHRSIYITRQQRVRKNLRQRLMSSVLTLWREMWAARVNAEVALEPQLARIIEELKYVKLRGGLRKLQRNIAISRRERASLREVSVRFHSKPIFLRALHMIRCAAYVKSFLTLKQHYIRSSPTQAEQLRSELHCESYHMRAAVRTWRQWSDRCSHARKSGLRSEANRRALMGLLLRESRVWHIVQPSRPGGSTSMSTDTFFELPVVRSMHLTTAAARHTVDAFQLRRALHRLGHFAQSTRVFFSLMELRFAQALCRCNMPSERRKYMGLVNSSSCRILPPLSPAARNGSGRTALARREPIFHNPAYPTNAAQQQISRLSAEKTWRLVGVHPQSLGLYMRNVLNSTSFERHRGGVDASITGTGEGAKSIKASAEFMIPFLQKPITTIDGGVLCNTPQLLRLMRRWRQTCRERTYLRKLADKVRRKQELKLLRLRYSEWVRCFHTEKECNRALRRHAMKKTRRFVARSQIIRRANELTQRGMVERHWLRLAAAHTHHTELRRLRAGHFYNSVMDNASPKALAFIAQHDLVPFSVRHFLSHHPSYRFPIYKQYDAAFWEHSSHSAAFEALGVLCRHFEVYGHESDLAHHLQMFQHHHHEEFRPLPPATAATEYKQQERVNLFPHNYASPAVRVASAASSSGTKSVRRERPLHLLPGAMLGPQAFSVSAAIGSRYRRSNDGSRYGRSGSPQKTRGTAYDTPTLLSPRLSAAKQARVAAVYHDPDVPARSELASAALFMSHWISQCLLQFYALRRGLYLLRNYTLFRRHKRTILRTAFLSNQRSALQVLERNRLDRKLTRQLQKYRLKKFSQRMRAGAVQLRHRRSTLLKVFRTMNHVYRYRVILRTWAASWRLKVRTAWDRLVQFTSTRARLVDQITALDEQRIVTSTVRTMCGVTTANLWRRRRNRVSGLRAFVCHYNRNVRAMDREEIVRQFALVKFFTVLKEHILSLLRQRLASVIGLNYRRKNGLIRGLMAIFSNVRQPHRNIREDVLRDRMHHLLQLLRRRHAMYASHQYSSYSSSFDEDAAVMRKLRTFNSFRQRQLMNSRERFNADFHPQTAPTAYVSATMPEPSPVPPAHTLDTPIRRASMLRLPVPVKVRLSHDELTEAPGTVAGAELRSSGNRGTPSSLRQSRSLSRSASVPAHSLLRPASAARLLFDGVQPSTSTVVGERRSALRAGVSMSVQTDEAELQPGSNGRVSTMISMLERRRSFLSLQAPSLTRHSTAADFDIGAAMGAAVSAANRSALRIPRSVQSPYLPESTYGSVRRSAEDAPLLVSTSGLPAVGDGASSSEYSSPAEEYSKALLSRGNSSRYEGTSKALSVASLRSADPRRGKTGSNQRSFRDDPALPRPESIYSAERQHPAQPRRYSTDNVTEEEDDAFSVRSDRDTHNPALTRPQSIYGLERRPSVGAESLTADWDGAGDDEASLGERSVRQEDAEHGMVRPKSIYGAERRASATDLSTAKDPVGADDGDAFDDDLSVRSDTDRDGPLLRPQSIYGAERHSARLTVDEEDEFSVRSDRDADDPALTRPQSIYGLERRTSVRQQGLHATAEQRLSEIDTAWRDDEDSAGERSARQERAERSILRPKSIYGAEGRSILSVAAGPRSGRSSMGGPRASVRWSIDDPPAAADPELATATGDAAEESSSEYSSPGYSLSPLLQPGKASQTNSSRSLARQNSASQGELRRGNSARSTPSRLPSSAAVGAVQGGAERWGADDVSMRSRSDRDGYLSRPSSIYGLERRSSSSPAAAQSHRSSAADDALWRSDQFSVRSEAGAGREASISRPPSVYGYSRHPSNAGMLSRGASAFSMASTIQTSASQLASMSQRSSGSRPPSLSRRNSLHDAYAEAVAALPPDSLSRSRANSFTDRSQRGSSMRGTAMAPAAADSDSDTNYSSVGSCSELFLPTSASGRSAMSRRASTSSMRIAKGSGGVSRKSSLHDLHAEALGPPSILVTSPAYSAPQRLMSRTESRINFQDSAEVKSNPPLSRPSSTVSLGGASRPSSRQTDASVSPLTTFDLENTPHSRSVPYFDDNSTEPPTLRRRDSVASLSGGARLHRPRSFIQAQRSEETAEHAQLLERGMQRGLWAKWRRQFLYHKYMNTFCDSHVVTRLCRVYLIVMRRQTLIDKFQRQLLLHITKRRALLRLRRLTLQSDERRQVAQFADKFFVVMALKLGLRRWRSRIKKTTARMSHYQNAEYFRRKRTFSLFLLNLRASSAPLATLGLAAAIKTSPDRAQVQSSRAAQRRTGGGGYESRSPAAAAAELGRSDGPAAHRTPRRLRFRSDSSESLEGAHSSSNSMRAARRSAPLSVSDIAALLHK